MANTRITQGVIKPNEDYDVRHINATGIVTAASVDVTNNLSVGGVLTYEDVTNVDSVGLITARKGIISSGVVTATAFHGSGASLTGIDATALKDPAGNVKVQAQASGAVHTGISTFDTIKVGSGVTIESNGQATFVGVVTFGSGSTTIDNNVVNVGTALTLGHTQGLQFHTQNLHASGFELNQLNLSGLSTFHDHVHLKDDKNLYFGDGNDGYIYWDGSNFSIRGSGPTYLRGSQVKISANGGSGGFWERIKVTSDEV